MKYLLAVLFILMIQNIYADCSDDQIDINSALHEELVKIDYIGDVRAEAIINSRPFESVEELIKVKGIGNWTLNKIKERGLACVDGIDEEENTNEEISEELVEPLGEENLPEEIKNFETIDIKEEVKPKNTELELIKLNPQTIKGESDNENLSKNNYPMYGLVIFCIVLGFLFTLRKNRFNKNEFK